MEESDRSATLIFTVKYSAKSKLFDVDSVDSLNNRGVEALSAGDDVFYRVCGDRFVSQLVRGGVLYIVVKLDFSNKPLKDDFKRNASGVFSDFSEINSMLSVLQSKYKNNLRIRISAHQVGGDAVALADILRVAGGGIENNCNGSVCLAIMNNLNDYVKKDGVLANSWRDRPAVLGVVTSEYSAVVSNTPVYESKLAQVDMDSRKNLFSALMLQSASMAKINSVMSSIFSPVIQSRWNELLPIYLDLKDSVQRNIDNINYAQNVCYSDLLGCESASINAISSLEYVDFPRDPSAVYYQGELNIYRSGRETYCVAPESSFIVGVGARVYKNNVKGVKIGYKLLGADGSLGATQYIQCGSGVEKYVEVPEGYVVTGVQARASNDNIAAISVFAKKWDSSSRALESNTMIYKNGDRFEMTLDLGKDVPSGFFNDVDHMLLTGIGFSVSSDNISGMTGRIGWIY